jgi:hypothetical protein
MPASIRDGCDYAKSSSISRAREYTRMRIVPRLNFGWIARSIIAALIAMLHTEISHVAARSIFLSEQ